MSPGIVAESDLTGALKSEYVFFDGERVARKDFPGNSVFYYFSDHLRTASVITDSAGSVKEDEDYYPWGGELQFVNSDSNHYKFTGKERDSETGFDYFGARYYGNWLGRFITPDWTAIPEPVPFADLEDPQSLNQYSYVRNIPTVKVDVDVDGHDGGVLEQGLEYVEDGLAKLVNSANPTLGSAHVSAFRRCFGLVSALCCQIVNKDAVCFGVSAFAPLFWEGIRRSRDTQWAVTDR